MNQSILSVRVNSNDKSDFEKFCSKTGMNVSVAINMFIKTVLREQKLPFEIRANNYDEYVYDKLKEAENQIDNKNLQYSSDEVFNSIENIIDNV